MQILVGFFSENVAYKALWLAFYRNYCPHLADWLFYVVSHMQSLEIPQLALGLHLQQYEEDETLKGYIPLLSIINNPFNCW